jgi:hypothetical protein
MQITFLGDATDTGAALWRSFGNQVEEDSNQPLLPAVLQTHRPDYSDLHAQVSNTPTIRQPRVSDRQRFASLPLMKIGQALHRR